MLHVLSYCSSDKYDRADVNTLFECCNVANGFPVGYFERRCRAAEDETSVRWQVASVKDGPRQPTLLSSQS